MVNLNPKTIGISHRMPTGIKSTVMKRVTRALMVIFTLVFVQGCSEEQPVQIAEKIRPAKLVTVEAASVKRTFSFPAVIQAAQSVELTFQIAGEVKELNVLEGDLVQLGDVIAKLDQSDMNSRLTQAQAEYDNALAEFERAEKLYAQDAISRSVLDTRRTHSDVARAALETAQNAFDNTTLKAPFAGRMSRVLIRQFQNIQAKEPIALLQSSAVEAVINAPSTIVTRARQMEEVKTQVMLDAAPTVPIEAQLKEVAGQADQATQTYAVSFSFTPPQQLLILPGMTATIELTFHFSDDANIVSEGIAVPLAAILAEGDNKYVWLVSQDGVIRKQAVQIQPNLGETITVLDGLNSGDTIVGAGVSFFHEGMKVRPWTPQ